MSLHRSVGSLLVVALAVLAAYAAAPSLGLVYDDHRLVAANPALDAPWWTLYTGDLTGAGGWTLYRPLVGSSWKLERLAADPVPIHHTVNVLWHVAAAWLVLGLIVAVSKRLTWGATLLATLFAVHPLASEPVVWVSRRADVMAGALALAAVAAWARAGPGHRLWTGVAVVSAAAAVLSKEIGVVVPCVWVVVSITGGHGRRRVAAAATWAIGFAIAIGALRWAVFGSVVGQPVQFVQNWTNGLPDTSRVEAALALIAHAARLVLVPVPLSADYSWRTLDPDAWSAAPLVGALVVLIVLVAIARSIRRSPLVAVGLSLAAIAYVPVSNLVVPIGAAFGERFLYLPLAGVLVAVAALDRHRAFVPIAGVLVVGAFVATRERVPDWTNDDTLFSAVVEAYPNNVVAQTYRGISHRSRGRLDEAVHAYSVALDVHPEYHLARVNRAFIYLDTGRVDEALADARWIVEREPAPGAPHLVTAIGLEMQGNDEGAEAAYWRAAADPAIRRDAAGRLAALYQRLGDTSGLERLRRSFR